MMYTNNKRALVGMFLSIVFALFSCGKDEEVVLSSYMEPIPPHPKYQFVRSGVSSVDMFVPRQVRLHLDNVYRSYLKTANFVQAYLYDEMMGIYRNGDDGDVHPESFVASSFLRGDIREQVREDLLALMRSSRELSGYGQENEAVYRRRPIARGQGGLIGVNLSGADEAYGDAKGLVVSDAWQMSLLGAVCIDQIFGEHLRPELYLDRKLQLEHEALLFEPGANYTALEGHWDKAWGYYQALKPWAQSDGLPALKDVEYQISLAFAQGRLDVTEFRYDGAVEQIRRIRSLFARVVGYRIDNLLTGQITKLNLDEDPPYAFVLLSQGYGLIYSLPFLVDVEGQGYFTYDEMQKLLSSLMAGDGFWETDRLLSSQEVEGSLANISNTVLSGLHLVKNK